MESIHLQYLTTLMMELTGTKEMQAQYLPKLGLILESQVGYEILH